MFLLLPLPLFGAGVALEEVFFDPEGADTGNEWIAIVNNGNEPQDLTGWQVYPDRIGYFMFPSGFFLAPGSRLTIRLRAEGSSFAGNLYHGSASSNMGNTSGSAALFSGEPRGRDTIKSFVQWGRAGETWESAADSAGIWTKGEFLDLSSFSPGQSIARVSEEIGKSAWRIGAPLSHTFAGAQSGESIGKDIPSSSPPPSAQSSSPSQSFAPQNLPPPSFAIDAGEDRTVIAGSSVVFEGAITIFRGSISEKDARFLWDFGDGTISEGFSVSHTFRSAGDYRASLHVSHENETQSDYVSVHVLPNQSIPSVVIEEKEESHQSGKGTSPSAFPEKTASSPEASLSQKKEGAGEGAAEALSRPSSEKTKARQNPAFSSGDEAFSKEEERAKDDSLKKDAAAVSHAPAGSASFVILALLAFTLSLSAAAGFIVWKTLLP